MNIYDWQVTIKQAIARIGREVWVYRKSSSGGTELLQADGTVETVDYGSGKEAKPTYFLDEEVFRAIVQEAMRTVPPPEKMYLEGKNEALEKHLQDLRHLLKLPK